MNTLLWIDIIEEIKAEIEKDINNVIIGALEPSNYANEGVVFIIRDREYLSTVKNMHSDNIITQEIYIENWTRDDSTDVCNGYKILAEQEQKVFNALQNWLTNTEKCIISADVLEIISDGDTKRPLVGSRMTLKIQYSF